MPKATNEMPDKSSVLEGEVMTALINKLSEIEEGFWWRLVFSLPVFFGACYGFTEIANGNIFAYGILCLAGAMFVLIAGSISW